MGHVLNYTLGDVVTHFRRRNGFTVLRPMGYDAFGLPAENAAIKEGGHPREITDRNIASIGRQMRRLGWAIDWDREVSAHEPGFYRWTQWLFLKLSRARPRLPQGCTRQLVPQRPDGALERACDRRPLRALRRRGRGPQHGAVVLQDHPRTRTPCWKATRRSTGPNGRRRSRATGSAAPKAPRCSSGSKTSTSTSRSSRRGPTRSSGRRSSSSPPRARWSSCWSTGPSDADEVRAYARIAGARSTAGARDP